MQTRSILITLTFLSTLGLAPAADASVQPNDAVTRTFGEAVVSILEFKNPGLGIQSPTAPCPAVLYNVQVSIPNLVYYQDDREGTNFKLGSVLLLTGQPPIVLLAGPCPIPGSGPGAPVFLTIPNSNVWFPYDGVSIDQALCVQGNFGPVDCYPDPLTARAAISHCNKNDAVFQPSPNDGKSALANLAGSRAIDCLDDPGNPDDGFKYTVEYYDALPLGPQKYCSDWFFDVNDWGTDGCVIQAEDTTPLGNGIDETGYMVTCMQVEALVIDIKKADPVYTMSFQSHDYRLILDLDGTPENWVDAKLIHSANNLQGWHDLGGKNGYPCPLGETPPDKKGDFPIIPTPFSPKKGQQPQTPLCAQTYSAGPNGINENGGGDDEVTTYPCPLSTCSVPAGQVSVAATGPSFQPAPIGRLTCIGGGVLTTSATGSFIPPGLYTDNTAGTIVAGVGAVCDHQSFGAAIFSIVKCNTP